MCKVDGFSSTQKLIDDQTIAPGTQLQRFSVA
jgi:hypothetical protein